MVKGNCGKGKKEHLWKGEEGSLPYLKNFRKGLRFQTEQCEEYLRNAVDAAAADSITKHLQWIIHKQRLLVTYGLMVSDSQGYPLFLTD